MKRRKGPIKRFINCIKRWKTRKTVLFTAIVMCVLYTFTNCLFGILNAKYGVVFSFDSTQTTEWFGFWKWVVISGGAITVAKVAKGSTNSDGDESSQNSTKEEPKG